MNILIALNGHVNKHRACIFEPFPGENDRESLERCPTRKSGERAARRSVMFPSVTPDNTLGLRRLCYGVLCTWWRVAIVLRARPYNFQIEFHVPGFTNASGACFLVFWVPICLTRGPRRRRVPHIILARRCSRTLTSSILHITRKLSIRPLQMRNPLPPHCPVSNFVHLAFLPWCGK